MFIKSVSLFILIASVDANLGDKSDVKIQAGNSDIHVSHTTLGTSELSHLNTECVEDLEFYHPPSRRCQQCSQYCSDPTTIFCKASCPNYCPDGFRHPILKRCISCSQLCNKDNLLSVQDKEFCDNNCDLNKERCPDGEFYYQPSDICLPCSNVCGPNRKKGYCNRNCPGYLLKESTREIGLSTIILPAITPAANSIPNSTSPDSSVTFVEFFNQRPYLVISIIGILVVLLIAAIAGLVGIILLRKNRNSGSRGFENDLLPRGVSATNARGFAENTFDSSPIYSRIGDVTPYSPTSTPTNTSDLQTHPKQAYVGLIWNKKDIQGDNLNVNGPNCNLMEDSECDSTDPIYKPDSLYAYIAPSNASSRRNSISNQHSFTV